MLYDPGSGVNRYCMAYLEGLIYKEKPNGAVAALGQITNFTRIDY